MPTRLFFNASGKTVWQRVLQAFILTSVEAFLAVICLIAGIPVLIDPSTFAPASIRALSGWFVYPWAVGMLSGGGLTLLGIGKGTLRLERMGIAILGAVSFVMSIALFGAPVVSALGIVTYVAFTFAMVARYWVLGQLINHRNELQSRVIDILSKDGASDGD